MRLGPCCPIKDGIQRKYVREVQWKKCLLPCWDAVRAGIGEALKKTLRNSVRKLVEVGTCPVDGTEP